MKFWLLIACSLVAKVAAAQQILAKIDSVIAESAQVTIDSTQQLLSIPDRLLSTYGRPLAEIQHGFTYRADSIQQAFRKQVQQYDSVQQLLQSRIDILLARKLPFQKLKEKKDSLEAVKDKVIDQHTSGLNSLRKKTKSKLDSLQLPPELKSQVGKYSSQLDNIGLNTATLPEIEIGNIKLSQIPSIQQTDFLTNLNVPGVDLPTGSLQELSQTARGWSEDASAIVHGNLNEVQQLPKTIENAIANRDEIKALTSQSKEVEKMTSLTSEEEVRQQIEEQASEAAIEHFAGKEEALQQTMEKLSKYKQKYSSINSLVDLRKRPTNPLRGKPFIERLVSGASFQYLRINTIAMWDAYVYCGYKLVPRVQAGLGWNQRIPYNTDSKTFLPISMYGPRAYTDVRVYRKFIAHVEAEYLNTNVYRDYNGYRSHADRNWVCSVFTGLKTEYKITRWLRGTALFQYNLFDRHHRAPYVDRVNSRFGLEFQMRKRNHL